MGDTDLNIESDRSRTSDFVQLRRDFYRRGIDVGDYPQEVAPVKRARLLGISVAWVMQALELSLIPLLQASPTTSPDPSESNL